MKIVKAVVALTFITLVVTFSISPALALDGDEIPIDHEQMIYDGWEYVDGEAYYINETLWPRISLFSASNPHYPDWNPDNLPWQDMPKHVLDIVYDTISNEDFFLTDYTNFKIPFMMINFNGEYCSMYVGYNLAAVYNETSQVFNVCSGSPLSYNSYKNAVCYVAQYNSDYSLRTDWYTAEGEYWGNSRQIVYYSLFSMTKERENDIYYYGGSGITLTLATQVSTWLSETDSGEHSNQCYWVSQTNIGYSSGYPFVWQQDSFNAYFKYYTAPTEKEIEQNFLTKLINDLKNYLLYFSDEEPAHINPFSNVLTDLNNEVNGYKGNINQFTDTLDTTLNNVISYVSTGSTILSTLFDGVSILLYFVIFFMAFSIIRKVVGR